MAGSVAFEPNCVTWHSFQMAQELSDCLTPPNDRYRISVPSRNSEHRIHLGKQKCSALCCLSLSLSLGVGEPGERTQETEEAYNHRAPLHMPADLPHVPCMTPKFQTPPSGKGGGNYSSLGRRTRGGLSAGSPALPCCRSCRRQSGGPRRWPRPAGACPAASHAHSHAPATPLLPGLLRGSEPPAAAAAGLSGGEHCPRSSRDPGTPKHPKPARRRGKSGEILSWSLEPDRPTRRTQQARQGRVGRECSLVGWTRAHQLF